MCPSATLACHPWHEWRPIVFDPARSSGARTATFTYDATHPRQLSIFPYDYTLPLCNPYVRLQPPCRQLPSPNPQPCSAPTKSLPHTPYAFVRPGNTPHNSTWSPTVWPSPIGTHAVHAAVPFHPSCALTAPCIPVATTHTAAPSPVRHQRSGLRLCRCLCSLSRAPQCVGHTVCPPVGGARIRLCCYRPCCRPCNHCRSRTAASLAHVGCPWGWDAA